MSESNNTWKVGEHQVEIEHSTFTGKIVVTLDGDEVGDDRMLARKKKIDFPVDGKNAEVTVEFAYGGMGSKSALHVDGEFVEPLRR